MNKRALSEDAVMEDFQTIINKVKFVVASQGFRLRLVLEVTGNSFHSVKALFSCLNVFNLGKKLAKPELKSCIEEFEEKLNKIHIERKEQELTAKNAQSH